MNIESGKLVIGIGVVVILVGIIIYFFHDKLNWIGRLPGDIRIERENFRFYFPFMTMILFSLVATLVVWVIRKFF